MTGLHINFDKSTFTPIDIPTSRRGEPAGQHPLLPVATFPQTYLGLRLSIHKVRLTDLQLLTKSVSSYIPEWCGKLLSPSGRALLINVVLGAWSVYAMVPSCFPKVLFKRSTPSVGPSSGARDNQCKVAWEIICLEKNLGGMGVKISPLRTRGSCSSSIGRFSSHPRPTSSVGSTASTVPVVGGRLPSTKNTCYVMV
jgi:hypothetical protein